MNAEVWKGVEPPLECYIARNKSTVILEESASGGVFSALASSVLKRHGVVFGVQFANGKVAHACTETEEGVAVFRSSKYVQSDLGTSYSDVLAYLRNGRFVLFSGTPCQVAGLLSFLKIARVEKCLLERLYTVDFVCHGVGSPEVFRRYLEEKKKSGKQVLDFNMRSKRFGYRNASMKLKFDNGKTLYIPTKIDDYLDVFYSDLVLRPSCYSCGFKSARHVSDVTLWDSWEAEKVLGVKYDDMGFTNVAVQTEQGKELFNLSRAFLDSFEVQFESIRPKSGGMMLFSAQENDQRGAFWDCMYADGLNAAIKRFLPKTLFDKAKSAIKPALYSVGLLDVFARIFRRAKGKR